jgi:hypothetical protein
MPCRCTHCQALEAALGAAATLGLTREEHPELGDALSTREVLKKKMEEDAAKLAKELKVTTHLKRACI